MLLNLSSHITVSFKINLNKSLSLNRDKTFKFIIGSIFLLNVFECDKRTDQAFAFENAIKVVKGPKTNGPQPTNLGLDKKGQLRICMKPSPNCFSTTPDSLSNSDEDDEAEAGILREESHRIELWKYIKGDPKKAYSIIGSVLENYEPGQSDIDGGGFKIVKKEESKNYYYVQFESLRRGFIDDFEIVVNPDCTIQVTSSSRLGYLDFQVNAKRINYIADKLQPYGFDVKKITPKTHPVYFESNA